MLRFISPAFLISCLLRVNPAAGKSGSEDNLIATLLDGYSKDARPPPADQATDVHIGFFLSSIDDVEEHLQTLTVSGYITATWSDSRLAWNESDWIDLDRVVISADSVWKPDFALVDAVGDVFNGAFFTDYYGLSVGAQGNVTWVLQGSTSVRCDYNLSYYPFDIQTCEIRYESFSYPSYLLHLFTETTTINTDEYHESSEFQLTSTTAVSEEFVPEADGNYSNVVFTLTLKRRELYFMLNLVLPCILMAVLTCFVFLLPIMSGERVGLAITLLLSFSVFQLLVAGYLPMNSLFTPLLTIFILTAMFFNGVALIVTIFVLRIAERGAHPVPQWIDRFVLEKMGVFYGITKKRSNVSPEEVKLEPTIAVSSLEVSLTNTSLAHPSALEDLRSLYATVNKIKETLAKKEQHTKQEEKWRDVSKVLDMTMFLLFSLAVILLCIVCLVIVPTQSS